MGRRWFAHLTREEREYLEYVLYEEIEMQRWFSIRVSTILCGEILLPLQ
jgi:hypothetical protein